MYQYILIGLLSTAASQPATNDIEKIYASYKSEKIKFFTSSITKQNIKTKLEEYSKILNTALNKIQTIESKSKIPTISPEGNQLALDLELLEPIQNLVDSNFDKKSCSDAALLNELNTGNEKAEFEMVNNILDKLCK